MAFAIEIKSKALKGMEELEPKRKETVAAIVDILKEDPVPFRRLDVMKLKGYDSFYRIRMGDYRPV